MVVEGLMTYTGTSQQRVTEMFGIILPSSHVSLLYKGSMDITNS